MYIYINYIYRPLRMNALYKIPTQDKVVFFLLPPGVRAYTFDQYYSLGCCRLVVPLHARTGRPRGVHQPGRDGLICCRYQLKPCEYRQSSSKKCTSCFSALTPECRLRNSSNALVPPLRTPMMRHCGRRRVLFTVSTSGVRSAGVATDTLRQSSGYRSRPTSVRLNKRFRSKAKARDRLLRQSSRRRAVEFADDVERDECEI